MERKSSGFSFIDTTEALCDINTILPNFWRYCILSLKSWENCRRKSFNVNSHLPPCPQCCHDISGFPTWKTRPHHHLDSFSNIVESRICHTKPWLQESSGYGMAQKVCQLFLVIIWGARHLKEKKNSETFLLAYLPSSSQLRDLHKGHNAKNLALEFHLPGKRTYLLKVERKGSIHPQSVFSPATSIPFWGWG